MFTRTIEKIAREYIMQYPVVLITGPRQVGKTTLLQMIQENFHSKVSYVTLDDPMERDLAQNDPKLFLQKYQCPVIIDEIQYAPNLFIYIKIKVDQEKKTGMYWLTGSQIFSMMKNISESLAGRVGLLTMHSFSYNEIIKRPEIPFLPQSKSLLNKEPIPSPINDIYARIFRGGMPKLISNDDISSEGYFNSYLQTYIKRDINEILNIKNESKFLSFISSVAARTGQELVYEDLAKDCDIDVKTAKSWMSALVTTGNVSLLKPYFNNTIKRIIKRPKIIFMDTGLCCYLARWTDWKTLEIGAMSGSIFETYVISEIIKSYNNNGKDTDGRLFYYRDSNMREIDLLIIENGTVHPIEIKKSTYPGITAIKNFNVCKNMGLEIGEGGVICLCDKISPINDKNWYIPISLI